MAYCKMIKPNTIKLYQIPLIYLTLYQMPHLLYQMPWHFVQPLSQMPSNVPNATHIFHIVPNATSIVPNAMAFCTTVKRNAIKLYQMPPINLTIYLSIYLSIYLYLSIYHVLPIIDELFNMLVIFLFPGVNNRAELIPLPRASRGFGTMVYYNISNTFLFQPEQTWTDQ